jgi:hypothetical protein
MTARGRPAPSETFPSPCFPIFCISIPANQHKGIKKTAELHKSFPVLLFPFQHAQNTSVICITSDKTKKINSVLLHKQIQLFCLNKSIYKKK